MDNNTSSRTSPTTKPLYRGTRIVWYVLGVVEVLLAFRFALKLLAANPAAGFTNFIYTLSYPLAAPFLAVFKVSRLEGNILEWTTVLAMFVYWVLAMGIGKLLVMSRTVSTPEAASKLSTQDKI